MSTAETYVEFGPDVPIGVLPQPFRDCLPGNPASADCDAIVGSTQIGTGYCSVDPYRRMSYCACVNNKIPCPMIAAVACANSAYAYLPTGMTPPDGAKYVSCKSSPICVNLVDVGGSQNVVPGVVQQCGTVTNVTRSITANPALVALALVLIFVIAAFLWLRPSAPAAAAGQLEPMMQIT
jgi:hypothetical protein